MEKQLKIKWLEINRDNVRLAAEIKGLDGEIYKEFEFLTSIRDLRRIGGRMVYVSEIPADWWEDVEESKPKTREEMKELFTETFKDAPFITQENIEKMADIFLPLSPKPDFSGAEFMKGYYEFLQDLLLKNSSLKSAPESEKVLTADGIIGAFEDAYGSNPDSWKNGFARGVNDSRDNWRLERDQELRAFLEAFCVIYKHWAANDYMNVGYKAINNAMVEFKNIKPLKAE